MELRTYQLQAVAAIERELTAHRSMLLVLATGLGKTVTFAEVARRTVAAGGRVLVLAHRAELIDQAARTLSRFGLAVGVEMAERRADRLMPPDVTIASVQTLQGRRLESLSPDAFALIVIDEAHHSAAKGYRRLLDYFASARVLGVTATPDRGDAVGLGNVFESVAYRYELREGIAAGFLAPLDLRTVRVEGLDLSRVHSRAGDLAADELEDELTSEQVLHGIARPLAELSAGRPTLAFTVGVKQAHALAEVLGAYGARAAAVDGSMTTEKRKSVLDDYTAGHVQIVANAMLWTEGFDAPRTSCVALVRPTRSRALLCQMIGRGTRLAEGKTSCLILDFVPERAARMRLSSPADVLAGKELPPDVSELVAEISGGAARSLGDAIASAEQLLAHREAERQESERREAIETNRRKMQVVYEVLGVDVAGLFDAPDAADDDCEASRATPRQLDALRSQGLDVPDSVSRVDASRLLDALTQRRRHGLCTLKQARTLKRYGIPHDVSFDDASAWLDELARNRWKPTERLRELAREHGRARQDSHSGQISPP